MKHLKYILLVLFSISILFTGCYEKPIEFKNIDTNIKVIKTIEPYGLFNYNSKDKRVLYDVSITSVILSIIFIETLVVPAVCMGFYLFYPVKQDTSIIIKDK